MSKAFGKIVLASTIIAGAAVGAYSYIKKNKDTSDDPAVESEDGEDIQTSDSFTDNITAKTRNYVDLASTKLEKPMAEAKEAVSEAKEVVSGAFTEAKSAFSDVAKEVKTAVAGAAKEIKDVVSEAKEANADAAADPAEDAEAQATEFEEGLQAESVEADSEKIIGSESSEEFFNDEDKQ